jgi:hypothetical protein
VIEHRLQRQARIGTAQTGLRLGKQVRVCDMQNPDWGSRFMNDA